MVSKKTKQNNFFIALWLLLFIILVIVFLVKKDDFIANLKSTNFFERVTGSTPEFIQNYEVKEKKQETNGLLDIDIVNTPGAAETQAPGTFDLEDLKPKGSSDKNKNKSSKEETPAENEAENTEQDYEEKQETQKPIPTMNVKLFFVQVNQDGNVNRKNIVRAIPKSESPLTSTIRTLLDGPANNEKDCMSLIPKGTRLLSANVRNGIAALNFSEEFEFNAIGAEGYRAQLMQIVFTATEFATVESVQFLIEGQHKDYIGSGEDIWMWIGSPYSRSNFK